MQAVVTEHLLFPAPTNRGTNGRKNVFAVTASEETPGPAPKRDMCALPYHIHAIYAIGDRVIRG